MGSSFSTTTLKVALRGCIERMKLVTNKKLINIKNISKELSILLNNNKEENARIRCESLIAEENILKVFEIMNVYCEMLLIRINYIEVEIKCPDEMLENIASIIYCAKRLEINEFVDIANQLALKYSAEFAHEHYENKHNKVNPKIVALLSVKPPDVDIVVEHLEDIADEYKIKWKPKKVAKVIAPAPAVSLPQPVVFLQAQSNFSTPIYQSNNIPFPTEPGLSPQIDPSVSDRGIVNLVSQPSHSSQETVVFENANTFNNALYKTEILPVDKMVANKPPPAYHIDLDEIDLPSAPVIHDLPDIPPSALKGDSNV